MSSEVENSIAVADKLFQNVTTKIAELTPAVKEAAIAAINHEATKELAMSYYYAAFFGVLFLICGFIFVACFQQMTDNKEDSLDVLMVFSGFVLLISFVLTMINVVHIVWWNIVLANPEGELALRVMERIL